MRGFGEPSEQRQGKVFSTHTTGILYPWGFGDPDAGVDYASQPDAGFGDILPAAGLGMLLSPTRDLPDDGGIFIEVNGIFPALGNSPLVTEAGPFQVQLLDIHTGERYPKDVVGCHSGIIGKGNKCYTNLRHSKLGFVLPPLPLSEYTIEIRYGDSLETLITLVNAFRIVHRTREVETYGARSHLSSVLNPGARLSDLETLRGK